MTDVDAMYVLTLLVISVTAFLVNWCFERPKNMNIPGNNGRWPILGDTMRLLSPYTMATYQVASRKRWQSPVWRSCVLFKKCIFVSGNRHMKQLASEEMTKRNTQACFPPHHKALFGKHSILVTSGDEHDKLRKIIGPLLQPQLYQKEITLTVSSFVEDCLRCCTSNVNDTEPMEPHYIPLVPKFKQFTLCVALRIVIGDQRWSIWSTESMSKILTLLDDFAIWSKGLLSAPTTSIPFTPAYRAMSARRRIKKFLTHIIEEEKKSVGVKLDDSHWSTEDSLIRLLLKQGEKNRFITDDVIVDNILTFLFAGTDTTASILTSAFYELARNSSVRERLQSYVNNISVDNETIDKILLAFISEVQRMYPSAPFTMREVVREGINMGSQLGTIPSGYLVTYAIAGTLLDDEISYPNPQVFDIDRWFLKSDSKISSIPPVCAFGGGNRICPGRFLANAEILALLRRVLSRKDGFEWKLKKYQKLDFSYTPGFFPADGLLVSIMTNNGDEI